jgi:tRNA pseudouridine38-40 synthase
MPRYRLTIEYDGRPFVGWQRQDNGPSVQAAIEEAVCRFSGEAATVIGAGRTDAGVHALGQVAHVDLARTYPLATVRNALNYYLASRPVTVLATDEAAKGFHARFSACRRTYRYRLLDRPTPPALEQGRVWWVPHRLDEVRMAEAAAMLVGRHDFSSFRASLCQSRSPVKTIDDIQLLRVGEEIHLVVIARSFLHHQVRIIAGTLRLVGAGKWSPEQVADALAARDRRRAGPTAPPHGLYLVAVGYPCDDRLPASSG